MLRRSNVPELRESSKNEQLSGRLLPLPSQSSPRAPLIFSLLSILLFTGYLFFLAMDIGPFLLDPDWTTDDSLQQVYPFYQVLEPSLYPDDLITSVMKGYLAPLHSAVCSAVTWLVGDPIIMAHIVMLLQIGLTAAFLFLGIKACSHWSVGLLGVTWFLHTRPVIQRMTEGLPRGWAAPVLAAFTYFLLTGRHRAVLVVLLAGCLLHPPATFIAALTYGVTLAVFSVFGSKREEFRKWLLILLLLSPGYVFVTYKVIERPPEVGQMVDFETASAMPEFQRPNGRFPFLPLDKIDWELKSYAFQPFISRLHRPGLWWRGEYRSSSALRWVFVYGASTFLLVALLVSVAQRRVVIPAPVVLLGVFSVAVYFLARLLAFQLYVPNRHLQLPMAVFWIFACSIGLWNLLTYRGQERVAAGRDAGAATLALLLGFGILIGSVVVGSGDGLVGSANFNYHRFKKGKAFEWLRKFTPTDALIAGHPTHIDAVQLFAKRKALATTETAHPFYPKYYYEMRRRIEISLRAHYAQSAEEFLGLLEPEGVKFFVFSRKRFYPEALLQERYFAPIGKLVDELTARPIQSYFYKKLPRRVDTEKNPYLVFRDDQSAVVDVEKLHEAIKGAP